MKTSLSILSFLCLLTVATISGCGGNSGEAKFDPSTAPEFTEADQEAMDDYEAQLKKSQEEQYGSN